MSGWPTQDAVRKGASAVRTLRANLGDEPGATEAARVAVTAAGLPDLVSHAEVRAILGTRNPRLPAGTPAPLYDDVGGRALWLKDDIESFAVEFQARPHVRSRRTS